MRVIRRIYPALFAVAPVLSLYAHNAGQVALREFAMPAIVTVIAGGTLFLAARAFYRDHHRAAFATSAVILLVYSYGPVQGIVGRVALRGVSLGGPKILTPAFVLLMLVVAILIRRTTKNFHPITTVLSVAAVGMVAVPLVQIIAYKLGSPRDAMSVTCTDSGLVIDPAIAPPPDDSPDIYYIILDRYPSAASLDQYYEFDNSGFVKFLESSGFYVADDAFSNYLITSQSLASSLNMDYINCLNERMGDNSDNWMPLFAMLEDYHVWRFLKGRGYRFVHVGTGWHPTSRNDFADVNHNLYVIPEFSSLLLQGTIFHPFLIRSGLTSVREEKWKRIRHNFAALADIPRQKGPNFVFAHFLLPHDPYVFDSDGTFTPPETVNARSRKQNFLAHIRYTNEQVRRLIIALQQQSPRPPVIIVQGDEGPYPAACTDLHFDWRTASDEQLREKTGILNALYMPGASADRFYPSMTPVNTFRVVFNTYFGTDYQHLDDRTYGFVDVTHLYQFFEVTDSLR